MARAKRGPSKAEINRMVKAHRQKRREEAIAEGRVAPKARYSPPPPWPQTLDDLAARCGPYADLAINHLKSRLAGKWKRGDWQLPDERAFPDLPETTRKLLWECHSRYEWSLLFDAGAATDSANTLDIFSPDARAEAVRTVEETIAEWEAAGSPGLNHSALLDKHDDLLRWIESNGLPDFEGSGIGVKAPSYSPAYLARLTPKRRAFYEQLDLKPLTEGQLNFSIALDRIFSK